MSVTKNDIWANNFNYYFILLAVVGAYISKCIYYAVVIKEGIPPDESMHLSLISEFQKEFKFFVDPKNINPGYGGVASQDRFLYHFLMANTIGKIDIFTSNLFNYRFFNILISLANLFVFHRILKEVFADRASIIVALILYTNILMFSVLSSSVSYDNLINLLSVSYIFLWIRIYKKSKLIDHVGIIIILLIGFLTKPSFWPLVVPYAFLVLKDVREFGVSEIFIHFRRYAKEGSRGKMLTLFSLLLISVVMVSSVLFRNYSLYGKAMNLNCSRIYGTEICRQQDELSKVYRLIRERNAGIDRLGVIEYYDDWIDLILDRTFGFFGDKIMLLSKAESQIVKSIMAVFMFVFIYKFKKASILIKTLTYFLLFYGVVVFYYVNYLSYLGHGQFDAGVHGRYLFPVLSCIVILFTYAFYDTWESKKMGVAFTVPLLSLFIWLDYPSFSNDIQKSLIVTKINVDYAESDLLKGDSKGMKVTLDSYNDSIILDNAELIELNDEMNELVIEGWAVDEISKELGSRLLFKINNEKIIAAIYGFPRNDVAKSFGSSKLINSGFRVVIPIEDLSLEKNVIEIILIDKFDKYFSDTRKFELNF